jgi:hypothetical protein
MWFTGINYYKLAAERDHDSRKKLGERKKL